MQLLETRDSDVSDFQVKFSPQHCIGSLTSLKKNNFYHHNHSEVCAKRPGTEKTATTYFRVSVEEFFVRNRRRLRPGTNSGFELVAARMEHSQPRGFCFSGRELFSGRLRGCAALRGIDGHILVV
jgi:hypothetical protein